MSGQPRTALVTTLLASGVTGFQVALAAGAPWGELAWGGQHSGTLPDDLRVASAMSALVWAGAAVVAAHSDQGLVLRRARTAYAIVCTAGTVLNAASPSPLERWLWTPVAAGLALGMWRLRRG